MPARAISTWSVHRTLGSFHSGDAPGTPGSGQPNGGISLLDLPKELAERGFDALQICHFHLPATDEAYLGALRTAIADAGLTLDALLVDDGDLVHPTDADAHEAWIGGWLSIAAALGATRARLIAGKGDPTPENLAASAIRLSRLAAAHPDVRVITENWHGMLPDAASVLSLLERTEDVGLMIDLGNWTGSDKYDNLAAIAPLAESCHAKCHFDAHGPDSDDYRRTLTILRDAGYTGPLALIYDGPDADEWAGLAREAQIVDDIFGAVPTAG
jgi:sugar phosphate isomerase/epimerase